MHFKHVLPYSCRNPKRTSYESLWKIWVLLDAITNALILDFMEAKINSFAWQGWTVSMYNDNQQQNEDLLHDAVKLIFKEYLFKVAK